MNMIQLVEASPAGSIKTGRLHRDAHMITGTTLITANSVNGPNRKRKYSDKALRQIAAMAEGLPAYANHTAPELAFKPRDIKDLIGRHTNVKYDSSTGRVTSDLHLLQHQSPWVFALVEKLGDQIGNSLVSKGVVRMEGDTEVVDEIAALRSCDLVSDPATSKGLFEAVEEILESTGRESVRAVLDRILGGPAVPAGTHQKLAEALSRGPVVSPEAGSGETDLHTRLAQAIRR